MGCDGGGYAVYGDDRENERMRGVTLKDTKTTEKLEYSLGVV